MLMDTFPWRRFKRASSQSMINPFPRERKILPMPYSYSHGSVDPGLVAANARVASRMAGPTSDVSVPGMFKNPLGKMSPEELKDFREVLKEMNLDMKPEFVAGGNYGRTQEYAHQPSLFNEATAAEYQKRKKLFPYV